MANSYTQMRKAGAAARAMLVQAAAEAWGVDASTITISKGVLTAGDKTSTFGPLAAKAAQLTPPEDPPIKDPKDFVLIGKDRPKLDSHAKSTGQAVFTMDMDLPDMEYVVIRHAPMLGGTVASFDDAEAMKVPGVTAVRQIPQGVAVYATSTYAALAGRNALSVEWDDSKAETRSSAQMMDDLVNLAATGEMKVAEEAGDIDGTLTDAAQVIETEFRFPYLAHAPMEPLDAVIQVKDGSAETWGGYQFPGFDKQAVAGNLGIDPANVKLNVMLAGGSFGRRAQPSAQIGNEIGAIAKAAGRDGAWKLIWTREDDLAGGYYRPMTVHKMRGALDADGNVLGWHDVVVNQSIIAGGPMEQMMEDGKDPTSYEGVDQDALRPRQPAGELGPRRKRGAGPVVAVRGPHPHRLCDRGLPRPAARSRRQGPGPRPPRPAEIRHDPRPGRAGKGGRNGRLGRPEGERQQGLRRGPARNASTPTSPRSPRSRIATASRM